MPLIDKEWTDLRSIEHSQFSVRRMLALGPGLLSMLIHGSGLVFRLVFMLLLLRFSSSAVLGHYGLLVAIEVVVIYLAGFEFHTFTTRRYARRPNSGKLRLCAAAHGRMLLVSVPVAIALTIAALAFFRVQLNGGDIAAFAVVVGSGVIAQEVIRYMVLVSKPVHAVFVTFLRGAAWQPLIVPFIDVEAETIHAIVLAWACVSSIGTFWALYIMRHALTWSSQPHLRYLLHGLTASRRYYVIACASVIQGNVERFVLQLLLGPSAVGVFSFFQTLANTLQSLIQSAVLNISLGQLLTSFGQRLTDRVAYLHGVLARCLKGSLAISVLICILAVPLVMITSRPEYLHLLWVLPLLLLGQVLMMWTQPIHLALYGGHHDHTLMIVSLSALAGALVLNYAMVDAFGLSGAVLAPVTVGAGLALVRWRLLRSLLTKGQL